MTSKIESVVDTPVPRPWSPDRRWYALALVVLAEVFVAVDLIGTAFVYIDRADMAHYVDQAGLSHWSREFWGRFPVFPLMIDVFGRGRALHALNVVVSTAGACWLAMELMLTVRHRALGFAVGLWWMAIWRTGAIQLYHHAVLTEAISNGLLMAMVAALLQQLRRPSEATRWLLMVMIAVWALARPSNFTALFLGGLVMLAVGWRWGLPARPPGWHRVGPVMVVSGLTVPLLFMGLAPSTMYNVIPLWVVPEPEVLAWWQDQGMPVPEELDESAWMEDFDQQEVVPEPLQEWDQWVRENGTTTYARWMATHPGWVLDRYLAAYGPALTFVGKEPAFQAEQYVRGQGGRLAPARHLGDAVYPSAPLALVMWVLTVGALGGYLRAANYEGLPLARGWGWRWR